MPIIPNTPEGSFVQGTATNLELNTVRESLSAVQYERFDGVAGHKKGTLTHQHGWLAVSNTDTTEDIVPILDGVPQDLYDLEMTSSMLSSYAGEVTLKYNVTFDESCYLQHIDLFPHSVDAGTINEVYISRVGGTESTFIPLPKLVAGAWNLIYAGSFIALQGETYEILYKVIDRGTTTVVDGGWTKQDAVGGMPTAGKWTSNSNGTEVRISVYDLDGVDRRSEIAALGVGASLSFKETSSVDRYSEYVVTIDDGVSNDVALFTTTLNDEGNGGVRVGKICTTSLYSQASINTRYYVDQNGYTDPSWATITSSYELADTGENLITPAAIGLNLKVQPLIGATDWDYIALPDRIVASVPVGLSVDSVSSNTVINTNPNVWIALAGSQYTDISPLTLNAGNSYTSPFEVDATVLNKIDQWDTDDLPVWNTTTYELENLRENDVYHFRATLSCEDGSNPAQVDFKMIINNIDIVIFTNTVYISKGLGKTTNAEITGMFYVGAELSQYGGRFELDSSDTSDIIDAWNFGLMIERTNRG